MPRENCVEKEKENKVWRKKRSSESVSEVKKIGKCELLSSSLSCYVFAIILRLFVVVVLSNLFVSVKLIKNSTCVRKRAFFCGILSLLSLDFLPPFPSRPLPKKESFEENGKKVSANQEKESGEKSPQKTTSGEEGKECEKKIEKANSKNRKAIKTEPNLQWKRQKEQTLMLVFTSKIHHNFLCFMQA